MAPLIKKSYTTLAARKGLQTLHLDETPVTDVGLKELETALPRCRANFEE
jgi:hypothetical protein